MRLYFGLVTGLCHLTVVLSKESFNFEKINKFGLGNRIIPSLNKINPHGDFGFELNEEHPKPLPSTKPSPLQALRSPYKTLYQGNRVVNDTRVFRRHFNYSAKEDGHQLLCEGMFDCTISQMAIETTEAIPVILRGGAGYRYFMVIVKAKPGNELKGTVRAYCKKKRREPLLRQLEMSVPKRRFPIENNT